MRDKSNIPLLVSIAFIPVSVVWILFMVVAGIFAAPFACLDRIQRDAERVAMKATFIGFYWLGVCLLLKFGAPDIVYACGFFAALTGTLITAGWANPKRSGWKGAACIIAATVTTSHAVTNTVYFDLANFGADAVQYKQVRIEPDRSASFPRVEGNTVIGIDYGFKVTDSLGRFTNDMVSGTYNITFTNRFRATTFQITVPSTNYAGVLSAASLTTSGTNAPGNLAAYSQTAADGRFNMVFAVATNGTPIYRNPTNVNFIGATGHVVGATVHLGWTNAGGGGSGNVTDAGTTNSTRISQIGNSATTIKTAQAGNGLLSTNEGGTNLVWAVNPSIVAFQTDVVGSTNNATGSGYLVRSNAPTLFAVRFGPSGNVIIQESDGVLVFSNAASLQKYMELWTNGNIGVGIAGQYWTNRAHAVFQGEVRIPVLFTDVQYINLLILTNGIDAAWLKLSQALTNSGYGLFTGTNKFDGRVDVDWTPNGSFTLSTTNGSDTNIFTAVSTNGAANVTIRPDGFFRVGRNDFNRALEVDNNLGHVRVRYDNDSSAAQFPFLIQQRDTNSFVHSIGIGFDFAYHANTNIDRGANIKAVQRQEWTNGVNASIDAHLVFATMFNGSVADKFWMTDSGRFGNTNDPAFGFHLYGTAALPTLSSNASPVNTLGQLANGEIVKIANAGVGGGDVTTAQLNTASNVLWSASDTKQNGSAALTNLSGNPIPFTNMLVAGWGQALTTNSGVVTATLTNRGASIATNATSTTVGFSDAENVQIYNAWFHLTTNLVVSPTNLIVGRTICIRFDTNALTYDVVVTNTAANPVNWNFNIATNGSTSFTKTNTLRARLYLTAETNGVISAEMGYYR